MNLSVIIVNWKSGGLLRRCLDALPSACGPLTVEVFVVDNASGDGSIAEAQRSAQPFELIALERNIGFARANNLALKKARGEVLLLLNPDTEPRPGSLAALTEFFRLHPRAGIAGGKLLNPDGTVQPSVRRFPSTLVLALLLTRLARVSPRLRPFRAYLMEDFSYTQDARVDQAMGACLAIRRDLLLTVGTLDERYWMWFEEVDYCRRAGQQGREVWFVPSCEVVHALSTSFQQVSAVRKAWWFAGSALRYARKHHGVVSALVLLPLVPVFIGTGLVADVARLSQMRPLRSAFSRSMKTTLALLKTPVGDARFLGVLGVGATACFLAGFFSAQAGLLFLAAAWIAVGTWRYPWTAFLLLVAVAPFLLILKATIILGPLTALKDIVILTLFARVLRGGLPRLGSVRVPLLFLVGWSLVAFVRADALGLGLLRLRDLLLYIPMVFVTASLVSTTARRADFLRLFLGVSVLVLLLGVVQWQFFADGMVLRFDAARQVWDPRVSSVLAHPNIFGSYLLFVLPLAAGVALTVGIRPSARVAAGMLGVAGSIAAYATFSRSVWIACAVSFVTGVVILVALRRPRLVGAVALAGLLVGSVLLSVPRARTLVFSVVDPTYASNRERLDFFTGVLAGLSPVGAVGGEGLGDTATLLGREAGISLYQITAADVRDVQVAKARTFLDNAVAKTVVEQGVIGLVFAGWVGARVFHTALARFRRGSTPEQRAVGLAMGSLICGLAALWLFLDVPDLFPVNLYFWIFAGLVISQEQAQ